MRETINFKHELLFENSIAEISSISLECNYDESDNDVIGEFLIEGTYRSHELSLNKENFKFKVPFEYNFEEPISSGSAIVNVKDFTYNIDSDVLFIEIEYEVQGDKSEVRLFEEQEEFEAFLKEHEVETLDFKELNEIQEECTDIEEISEEILESTDLAGTTNVDIELEPVSEVADTRNISESIISEIGEREDTYITYHIHICDENDSLDTIAMKYKISTEVIKNYNDVDSISTGMKIIIPYQDE